MNGFQKNLEKINYGVPKSNGRPVGEEGNPMLMASGGTSKNHHHHQIILILIYNTIIIIISIITSINAIIINGTKDDILDLGKLFHLLTNFREQRLMPC